MGVMLGREAMKQKKVGSCCGRGILYREYHMQASWGLCPYLWGSMKVSCLLSSWLSVGLSRERKTCVEVTRDCTRDWSWSMLCSKTLPHQTLNHDSRDSLCNKCSVFKTESHIVQAGLTVQLRLSLKSWSDPSTYTSQAGLQAFTTISCILTAIQSRTFQKQTERGRCFPPANSFPTDPWDDAQNSETSAGPLSPVTVLYVMSAEIARSPQKGV